jgi:hypothetical protein
MPFIPRFASVEVALFVILRARLLELIVIAFLGGARSNTSLLPGCSSEGVAACSAGTDERGLGRLVQTVLKPSVSLSHMFVRSERCLSTLSCLFREHG